MSSPQEFVRFKIPLKDVLKATNNFADENIIGQGGFGKVYKGSLLWSGQQTVIAARRLHYDYGQGDFEFWQEISMLSDLKHENLVCFLGYCDEKREKIIINKHENLESLEKHLKDSNLTWTQRLHICVGVASAMNYIHFDVGRDYSVIHRNIKSSKILLDDNWKPKLSGFEHALRNTNHRRHRLLLAETIGTIGYADPTYEKTGFVNHKSDVYSLGVVLFEILCGRRAFIPDDQEQGSPQLVNLDTKNGNLDVENETQFVHGTDNKNIIPASSSNHKMTPLKDKDEDYLGTDITTFIPNDQDQGSPLLVNLDSENGKLEDHVETQLHTSTDKVSTSKYIITPLMIDDNINEDYVPEEDIPSFIKSFEGPIFSYERPLVHSFERQSFDGQMSSFIKERPCSFVGGQPSSFVGGRPSSFVDGRPSSFNDPGTYSGSDERREVDPTSYLVYEDDEDDFLDEESSPSSGKIDSVKTYSSKQQFITLQPLYTMKRLEKYVHMPKQGLLAQLAKSCYDNETLDDMIDPSLLEQIDPESLQIFSETAYSCLKEQRAHRPNIDQVVRNLNRALKLQMRRENLEQSINAGKVEGTSSSNRWKGTNMEHLKIPLGDILLATKKFTQKYLGSGAYGKVYRADLDLPIEDTNNSIISIKRKTVAIKCIKEDKNAEKGFVAEIKLLTSCKHPNIVNLLGFCDEGPHMILVYEYASNGSLDNYLGRTDKLITLTWVQRLKICIDIARGLNYLHNKSEEEERIVHRDIKSGNILLGVNLVAKIADFGLSRFHKVNKEKNTLYTNNIAGTEVYLDPEYMNTGRMKRAIDIYSFGVVLFEMLSGNFASDIVYMNENKMGIAPIARKRFEEGTINEMIDPKLMEEVDELSSTLNKGPNQESLKTFMEVAYRCVAETQDERPSAKDVVEELENALSLQENNKDNLRMTFEQIKSATENFSQENLIGEGGFGKTHKGKVSHPNGCDIIVAKRLDRSKGQGDHHFLTELEILFDYRHENIIGLEGYCNEMEEKIIVYEHASKKSLDMHLEDKDLTWTKRLKICIDIASGLSYLHGGALTNEVVIHRDIKSANILLNGDWKAKISDFGLSVITTLNQEVVSNLVGTQGYVDPLYEVTGFCTEKSDIYSFGVVLFEILYGKLLSPTRDYNHKRVTGILNRIHAERIVDSIVFEEIKEKIDPRSLSTFQMIVRACLHDDRKQRPTAKEVLQQLRKALELQEDYEIWEPKLPKGYTEIIKRSKSSGVVANHESKKDIYNMLIKGILLQDEKTWFSIGINGEKNEMISATRFSYRNRSPHNWQSLSESRFKKVAEMLDISNLMIKIKTASHFLSEDVLYGIYLVFKFRDSSKKHSTRPMHVNLKYKKRNESLHAHFATWRDDDWMMIELYRFLNDQNNNVVFKFLLESLSPYYYEDHAIYVEGVEFRAIDKGKLEVIRKLKEVQQVSVSYSDEGEKVEDGEKFFSVNEVNGKKHLMVSAKVALYNSSDLRIFNSISSAESRFQEVIELLPQKVFRIHCTIKSQRLSQDTEYVCYIIFKLSEKCEGLHCPIEVRNLRQREKKESEIIYFVSPSAWNIHDVTRVPEERHDGWMEVIVWEFNSNQEFKNDCIPVNLNLISYEGTISGLIVCGLEFRPI
ncbi:uncharacterized protein [Rutidosis leptorrhynchoides]|uniref:uncharacterized protein n=1 Tax=Rutidosis leptorrhynchoides TaxID=125765 RepID=UPI003A9A4485